MSWFDNAQLVGFYALGIVAIIASLRVIMLANPVHAILSMIVCLLALAGIFFIVGAPFAGALQVIVYAGAILVLFVFVIMMLNLGISNDTRENSWLSASVWAVPTGLTAIIAIVLYAMIALSGDASHFASDSIALPMIGVETISAKQVGILLFSKYLMLVEVAAMLLLAALVAAYHLGKKALDDENESHNSRQASHAMGYLPDSMSQENSMSPENSALNDSKNVSTYVSTYEYAPVSANDFANPSVRSSSNSSIDKKQLSPTGGLNQHKKEGS